MWFIPKTATGGVDVVAAVQPQEKFEIFTLIEAWKVKTRELQKSQFPSCLVN